MKKFKSSIICLVFVVIGWIGSQALGLLTEGSGFTNLAIASLSVFFIFVSFIFYIVIKDGFRNETSQGLLTSITTMCLGSVLGALANLPPQPLSIFAVLVVMVMISYVVNSVHLLMSDKEASD